MPRVFSGIQPTGDIHIGNYVGAVRNWVSLQDQFECIYCIVDYHAMTMPYQAEDLSRHVKEAFAWNLACGVDPEKATLFVQSDVPEHTELCWMLTCLTPLGSLERMTQFKDKTSRAGVGILTGLLVYPVLMAADILVYKADLVPVGEDQLQHLELAREIARKFNGTFGEMFPEPKGHLTQGARISALNDPTKKMSKSLAGSFVAIGDSPETMRSKLMRAVTDLGPRGEEMSPGVKNLFNLLEVFATPEIVAQFDAAYQEGALRYSDLKSTLADHMIAHFAPIQERHRELMAEPERIAEIAAYGAEKARRVARPVLDEAKALTGLGLR
jgi:tryptophanyl-tRNA synthetase